MKRSFYIIVFISLAAIGLWSFRVLEPGKTVSLPSIQVSHFKAHGKFMNFKLTLLNNFPRPIFFFSSSCNWQRNVVIDTPLFVNSYATVCSVSFYNKEEIYPHALSTNDLQFNLADPNDMMEKHKGLKFRVGFRWIAPDSTDGTPPGAEWERAKVDQLKANIIWSDTLEIK